MVGPQQRSEWEGRKTLIWLAREQALLTRDQVCMIIDPPISTKTLERWEKGERPIPHQRMRDLALIYRVPLRQVVPLD